VSYTDSLRREAAASAAWCFGLARASVQRDGVRRWAEDHARVSHDVLTAADPAEAASTFIAVWCATWFDLRAAEQRAQRRAARPGQMDALRRALDVARDPQWFALCVLSWSSRFDGCRGLDADDSCDEGYACWRHDHVHDIAERLMRLRDRRLGAAAPPRQRVTLSYARSVLGPVGLTEGERQEMRDAGRGHLAR
jgi:hypothetical protein